MMAVTSHTFKREERLKSRKLIETLFREGKAFSVFPYKIIFLPVDLPDWIYPVKAGFSISKRRFGLATQRNRIRRLTREAYRLQKHALYTTLEQQQQQLAVFFIYTGRDLPPFETVFDKISVILKRLPEESQKLKT